MKMMTRIGYIFAYLCAIAIVLAFMGVTVGRQSIEAAVATESNLPRCSDAQPQLQDALSRYLSALAGGSMPMTFEFSNFREQVEVLETRYCFAETKSTFHWGISVPMPTKTTYYTVQFTEDGNVYVEVLGY